MINLTLLSMSRAKNFQKHEILYGLYWL